jgi:pyroglutamyl-peptidase
VAALHGGRVGDHRIDGLTLEVQFDQAPRQILTHVDATNPAALMLTGVAKGSTQIRLEGLATNTIDRNRVDAAGHTGVPYGGDDQAATLKTTAPLNAILRALHTYDIDAVLSSDAGRYVCNSTYFRVLESLKGRGMETPCFFMHIPEEGVLNTRGEPWTPGTFVKAAHIALAAMVGDRAA